MSHASNIGGPLNTFMKNDLLVFARYRDAFELHRRLARALPGSDVSLAVRVGTGPVLLLLSFNVDDEMVWSRCPDTLPSGGGAVAAGPEIIDRATMLLGSVPATRVSVRDAVFF